MTDQQVPLREFLDDRHKALMTELVEIKLQVTATNGRLQKAEQDIAVLKDRANPWTAGGIGAGLVAALGAAYELFKR